MNNNLFIPNQFSFKEYIIISEIRRRIDTFKKGNVNAPMVYLGWPSEVKSLIVKGFITPYSREKKRCLTWYNLTEKGKAYIKPSYKTVPTPVYN